MLKFFKNPFAVSGDKVVVPDTVLDGTIAYGTGYPTAYQTPIASGGKAIERTKLNQVLFDITNEVQLLQKHGYPDYITSALNGGTAFAYDIGAVVRWTDNNNYRNTVAANTNNPVSGGWVLENDDSSAVHASASKTTPVNTDEFEILDSTSSFSLKKITWVNITTALSSLFVPLASPAFTGTPTAPSISYKSTPVNITAWSYSGTTTTTITLTVASHTFIVNDFISVNGLTTSAAVSASSNYIIPNGVYQVTAVTSTTIQYTIFTPLALAITLTPTVSSATVIGQTAINGVVGGLGSGGQQWVNMISQRAHNVTYYNTSLQPIQVCIEAQNSNIAAAPAFFINGVQIYGHGQYYTTNPVFVIIPSRAGYSYSGGSTAIVLWFELRKG